MAQAEGGIVTNHKGARWESKIVDYLQIVWGLRNVERRARNGAKDRGDIAGLPSVVIEAKDAVKYDLAGWTTEAERERLNDNAAIGAVWAHRRGKASPADGYVILPGSQFVQLLCEAGYIPPGEQP